MAIIIESTDRIIIQGITGQTGRRLAESMLANGNPLVGGVSPSKGDTTQSGLPVYSTVFQACRDSGATASFIIVPPLFVKEATLEALAAGIRTIVIYSESVPLHDVLQLYSIARAYPSVVLGPNSAGCVSPGRINLSDIQEMNLRPGPIGIVSRSGTLTYEVIELLNRIGLGQSTIVCLGGGSLCISGYSEILTRFENDAETSLVILVGEIGGRAEAAAAETVAKMKKPVVAYIAGQSCPPNKRFGHAGALIEKDQDRATAKIGFLQAAGARIAYSLYDIPEITTSIINDLSRGGTWIQGPRRDQENSHA